LFGRGFDSHRLAFLEEEEEEFLLIIEQSLLSNELFVRWRELCFGEHDFTTN
jgi:hypothetical protein